MEKKIHYCWFGGKKLPHNVKKCIKTWKEMLPDYQIIEWNENNFDLNACTFVNDAYKNKKWAFVSDYARIYVLYKEGGIYFDTDMKIIKDVHHVINKDMFFGYEDSGLVGTAVIGVKEKHNKYIKEILDYYNNLEEFNPELIYNYANPVIITKILKNYTSYINKDNIEIVDNNIYIYPRDYFYPLSYLYDEKEFTENTCMIHLFKATWTTSEEKRTISIYRHLGPDLGKVLNKIINKLIISKYKIKEKIKNIYNLLKMWYSIHINRNKRIKKIKKELEHKSSANIIICNPDKSLENQYIDKILGKNILFLRDQHTNKEAKLIAKVLINKGFSTIIFNSLSYGWENLINNIKKLKSNITIELLMCESNTRLSDKNIWSVRDTIMTLYEKKRINRLLFFNKALYDFYNQKGYNSKLLEINLNIKDKEKYKLNKQRKHIKIGMYTDNDEIGHNIFNQISAVSLLENVQLEVNPINYQISIFCRRLNVNLCGNPNILKQDELYYKLANNDINLCIDLLNYDSLMPLQSLELGTVCIVGNNCKLFNNSELEQYIKVDDEEDIIKISNKIKFILENKNMILDMYNSWKTHKGQKGIENMEELMFINRELKIENYVLKEKIASILSKNKNL